MSKTRKKIMDTARQLFAKNGFYQTTVRNIAEEAGLTTGPIYFKFRNKGQIFAEICQESLDILIKLRTEYINSTANLNENGEIAYKIKMFYIAYREFYLNYPEHYKILHFFLRNGPKKLKIDEADYLKIREKHIESVMLLHDITNEKELLPELKEEISPWSVTMFLIAIADGMLFFLEKPEFSMFPFEQEELDKLLLMAIDGFLDGSSNKD